jgi:hypothetical protein
MTREEAIEEVETAFDIWESEYDTGNDWSKAHKARDMAIKALEQEPKTGHWIDITNKNKTVIAVRCSCCEKSPKYAIKSDFCPNCGAKMV